MFVNLIEYIQHYNVKINMDKDVLVNIPNICEEIFEYTFRSDRVRSLLFSSYIDSLSLTKWL